jgi:hypothetical protein
LVGAVLMASGVVVHFVGIALGAISAVVIYHVMRLIGQWRGTVVVDQRGPATTGATDPEHPHIAERQEI